LAVTRERILFDGEEVVLAEEAHDSPAADEIEIETEYTLASVGTEVENIRQAAEAGEEYRFGYSHVGRVDCVGADADDALVGQRMLSLAPHASRVTMPADSPRTIPVPEGVSPDLATLGILGSVAYHIVERAAPGILESAAILGQGVVGSIATQLVANSGARPVVAIDLDDDRLERATATGADAAVNPSTEDAREAVEAVTDGEGVSLCIEAAASPDAYETAIDVLGLRGRLVVSSAVNEPVPFRINQDVVKRELTILGAFQPECPVEETPYYPWTQQENRRATLEDVRDGRLEVEHLLSHRVAPEQCTEMYDRLLEDDRSIVGLCFDWTDG
jgi:2-desacetyl-2-hydroxyethyl bacteriochlorophyllide A dehydrogenase